MAHFLPWLVEEKCGARIMTDRQTLPSASGQEGNGTVGTGVNWDPQSPVSGEVTS